jgi:hypothetical protein
MTRHKRKPSGGVLITVDETGKNRGEEYVVVATVTENRQQYRGITENYHHKNEMKFSNNVSKTPEIIKKANECVDGIYAVHTPIDSITDYEKTHYDMLRQLDSMIPYDPTKGLLVMVDESNEIDSEEVKKIFKKGKRRGDYTSCVVVPSNYFAEIQTNDFITGTVGSHYNNDDTVIVNKSGKEINCYSMLKKKLIAEEYDGDAPKQTCTQNIRNRFKGLSRHWRRRI